MADDLHTLAGTPGVPASLLVRVEEHCGRTIDVDVLCLSGDLDMEGLHELRLGLPARLAELLPAALGQDVRGAPAGQPHSGEAITTLTKPSAASTPARHRAHLVVADLAGVHFIDSSGIGGLLLLGRRLQEVGSRFAVCCLQPQPRQVLAITGADRLLSVHPTLADALRGTPPVMPAA